MGEKVLLKMLPTEGVNRFYVQGKLSPRFIETYDIIEKISKVPLPPKLSSVHNVFHISQLYKYIRDPTHVIFHTLIEFKEDLTCEKQPM